MQVAQFTQKHTALTQQLPWLSLYLLMVLGTMKFHLASQTMPSGVVFGSAQGGSSSSNEITWEGTTFVDGDTFFTLLM